MTANWITPERADALLWRLASPCEYDKELFRCPWNCAGDGVVTDGKYILRLDGRGQGLRDPPRDYGPKFAAFLDLSTYRPCRETTLDALAEWAGPHSPHWLDPDGDILPGLLPPCAVLLDRRLLSLPLSLLAAEHDRCLRRGERAGPLSVRVLHRGAERGALAGGGFLLMAMGLRDPGGRAVVSLAEGQP